jgi:hypothetical protein
VRCVMRGGFGPIWGLIRRWCKGSEAVGVEMGAARPDMTDLAGARALFPMLKLETEVTYTCHS